MEEKKKKYHKHINHAVKCAVCGKPFGASRSTAKYCGAKCRRLAYYAVKGYLGEITPEHIEVINPFDSLARMRGEPQKPRKTIVTPTWGVFGYVVSGGGKGSAAEMINDLLASIDYKNKITLNSRSFSKPNENERFRVTIIEPSKEQRKKITDSCSRIEYTDTKEVFKIEVFGHYDAPQECNSIAYTYVLKPNFTKYSVKR